MHVVGDSPSLGTEVTITTPGGGTFTTDPARWNIRVTPDGGATIEVAAWCVDRERSIWPGRDYEVDLTSSLDNPSLTTPAYREAGWLMAQASSLLASAASPGLEAASIQMAVWQLTGQAKDVANVTNHAQLNARTAALRALAQGKSLATSLALSAPATTVLVGTPAQLTVTGTPGATVDLSATAGQLSAAQVTLDANGRATVDLTATSAADVTVIATAAGGTIWKVAHVGQSDVPQDLAYVTPATLSATATVQVGAAVPAVVQQATPARTTLRLVKTAQARLVIGHTLRYTLRVTNRGKLTARNVVLRDRLPVNAYVTQRYGRGTLSGRTMTWRLGDIAPGATVTVRVNLKLLGRSPGRIGNLAAATAANARTVRDRAVTQVLRPAVAPERQAPAVTG
jgi:uncharacterized repeat protein (TIGR01451 family)